MKFLDYIRNISSLSLESGEALKSSLTKLALTRGTLLAEQGKYCKRLYFLEKGIVRGFHHKEGKDITSWFALENTMVTSLYAFIAQKVSYENIELLEDATLYSIGYDTLQGLYKKHRDIETIGRKLTEHYYIELEQRLMTLQFKTAKERYQQLLETAPSIIQRVALGHIASYLGISQETLSRIRAEA